MILGVSFEASKKRKVIREFGKVAVYVSNKPRWELCYRKADIKHMCRELLEYVTGKDKSEVMTLEKQTLNSCIPTFNKS